MLRRGHASLCITEGVYHKVTIYNGKNETLTLYEGSSSAAVGGPGSFPSILLDISKGNFPQGNQNEFVHVTNYPIPCCVARSELIVH